MKIKRELNKLFMLFIVPTICITFISCSSDDDGISVKSQLVGVWKTSIRASTWRVIELESNGIVHYSVSIDDYGILHYDSWAERNLAHWSFNEQDQTISMYRSDGEYSYTYKVNMSDDGNHWAGYTTNSNGETVTVSFTRVQDYVKK